MKNINSNINIVWKKHALVRMMERGISREWVRQAILTGKVIEDYQFDKPFPSYLICSLSPDPLHVVTSYDEQNDRLYVITVYQPDLEHFESDYITRRKQNE